MIFPEKFPELQINDEFILRQFTQKDAKDYFDLYTIPEVNQFIPDAMIPKTLDDARLEVESIIQTFTSQSTVYWGLVEKKTDRLIGGCGFHDWNRFNFRIEIAYDIHPDYWRRGLMVASIKEIVKFAFMTMGIARIQATTLKKNGASNNLLLKFGFKYEGILRKYKFFKGEMVDIMMFSYTIDDFSRDIKSGRLL